MKHVGNVTPVPTGLMLGGPLIEVVLSPHPSMVEKIISVGGTPVRVRTKLMVDTGAQYTLIENSLVKSLNIPPLRHTPLVGVSQKKDMCPVYLMGITLGMGHDDDPQRVEQLSFIGEMVGIPSPSSSAQYRGLLGRDFLRHFRFVYDGPNGAFEIQLVGDLPQPPQVTPSQIEAEKRLSRQERRRLERMEK